MTFVYPAVEFASVSLNIDMPAERAITVALSTCNRPVTTPSTSTGVRSVALLCPAKSGSVTSCIETNLQRRGKSKHAHRVSHKDMDAAARLVVDCTRAPVLGERKANSTLASVASLLVDAGVLAAVSACTSEISSAHNVTATRGALVDVDTGAHIAFVEKVAIVTDATRTVGTVLTAV